MGILLSSECRHKTAPMEPHCSAYPSDGFVKPPLGEQLAEQSFGDLEVLCGLAHSHPVGASTAQFFFNMMPARRAVCIRRLAVCRLLVANAPALRLDGLQHLTPAPDLDARHLSDGAHSLHQPGLCLWTWSRKRFHALIQGQQGGRAKGRPPHAAQVAGTAHLSIPPTVWRTGRATRPVQSNPRGFTHERP